MKNPERITQQNPAYDHQHRQQQDHNPQLPPGHPEHAPPPMRGSTAHDLTSSEVFPAKIHALRGISKKLIVESEVLKFICT
jgi:hypothetical protein